jgi:phage tail-like protein
MTQDKSFWDWLNEICDPTLSQNKVMRRNVNILVFNQAGEIMRSWTLIGAIPVAWKTANLQTDGNAVAIEELTLAFEGLNFDKTAGDRNTSERDKSGFFASS